MIAIAKTNIHYLTLFFAVVLFAPLIGNQLITGTIVNATLFVAVATIGLRAGFVLSIIPSIIAVVTGLLPIILAPIIPYIIVSNIILVVVFDKIKNKVFGILLASLSKFTFLFIISHFVVTFLVKSDLLSIMFGWTQLLTAIMGGCLAYIILDLKGRIC
ncbi:MAG: hypothetical protein BWY34_00085 [Parcubacteria group bacterium ADurb.Bin247]|jgi:hypothetical protein|nr:MAG: hypothetical protein BWY34_00085 [Parcubacteria group bacterium ADurb.Bin247]HQB84978.1 hypothetical protein [Candidatus Pacearchaeota archaeon]